IEGIIKSGWRREENLVAQERAIEASHPLPRTQALIVVQLFRTIRIRRSGQRFSRHMYRHRTLGQPQLQATGKFLSFFLIRLLLYLTILKSTATTPPPCA